MEFSQFNKRLIDHFNSMVVGVQTLFEVDVDKDEFWNLYLDSFPAGTNEIYRKRREFDCSCCRHFIKSFGSVVSIKNNTVETLWDFDAGNEVFQVVIDTLANYIKAFPVTDVYVSKDKRVGTEHSFENGEDGVTKWNHFFVELPEHLIDKSHKSVPEIKGERRDTRNVFGCSLDNITMESIETIMELISQNSLYKGEEWKGELTEFISYKRSYDSIQSDSAKRNFTWEKSVCAGVAIGRIRNHSIGTLLVNLSEGVELDVAVRKYEAIVAPANYKRPKAIFTQKMLEDAKKTINSLGYMDSLGRRFATLDDISVNNILFSNKDSAKRIVGGNIFEDMVKDISIDPKRFSRVEEIPVDSFVKNVLPTARELEVFFENKHSSNMVSLIAPENKDSKTMFKWNNGFSWAYTGNVTDSTMKERVKSAGGKVDGVLRFSIQWNDDDYNPNDFDAHCIEPSGNEIFYARKTNTSTTGELDVDIITPTKGTAAVENITWSTKSRMRLGVYKFFVHNYNHRGGRSGFKAEIEFDGQVYAFDYNKELRDSESVMVAEVTLSLSGQFSIVEKLPSTTSSREVWNLKTNTFTPVSVAMSSPNYWDEQDGIGHRHYFFMLKDCVNPELPNGFYNEFLKQELVEHKRVFEALGGKMAVQYVDDQLSGLGFSSTKRNDLLVKVIGNSERVLKIKF